MSAYFGRAHGRDLVRWMRKVRITGRVRIMGRCMDKCMRPGISYALQVFKNSWAQSFVAVICLVTIPAYNLKAQIPHTVDKLEFSKPADYSKLSWIDAFDALHNKLSKEY